METPKMKNTSSLTAASVRGVIAAAALLPCCNVRLGFKPPLSSGEGGEAHPGHPAASPRHAKDSNRLHLQLASMWTFGLHNKAAVPLTSGPSLASGGLKQHFHITMFRNQNVQCCPLRSDALSYAGWGRATIHRNLNRRGLVVERKKIEDHCEILCLNRHGILHYKLAVGCH